MLSLELSDIDRSILTDLLNAYDDLNCRIGLLERQLWDGLAAYHDDLKLLQTIPGIRRIAACELFVELGSDLTVLKNERHLMAWPGLCPGNNESADKRRSARTRQGNKTLRLIMTECAQAAARTKDCQFYGYHKSLMVRRGYKRAVVATAYKMLRVVYWVLHHQIPYLDPQANYESLIVSRNAARWIKQLREHGYLAEYPERYRQAA